MCVRAHLAHTPAGVAAGLRHKHGMEYDDATTLARRLLHPYQRCRICGLPNRIRAAYVREGKFKFLGHRMQADHVDPRGPGSLENLRPLCSLCNKTRGAAMYTDAEVLKKVSRWWRRRLTEEELWWLNSGAGSPTKGRKHEDESVRGDA